MRCPLLDHDQQGFTLLEFMIVATVIGLLAAIAVPSLLTLMPKYRLNGATRQVMSDLMAARMKAVSLNRRVKVFFPPLTSPDKIYKICDDANNDGTVDECEGNAQIKNIQADYSGITLKSSNNPIFFPRGTATNFATITIIKSENETKTITVAITGRVKIK